MGHVNSDCSSSRPIIAKFGFDSLEVMEILVKMLSVFSVANGKFRWGVETCPITLLLFLGRPGFEECSNKSQTLQFPDL